MIAWHSWSTHQHHGLPAQETETSIWANELVSNRDLTLVRTIMIYSFPFLLSLGFAY